MLSARTDVNALHKRHVLTPWSAQGSLDLPSIERAEGVYFYDSEGKRYLDLCAGLVAVNLGHGHPTVVEAITEQAKRLCFAPPSFFNDVRAELAAELSDLAGLPGGSRVMFTTGGAQANEDAVKLARTVTGRPKILTAYRSFHGSGGSSSTLTGENRRWFGEPGVPNVTHFFAPYPYRSPFQATDPAAETQRALEHLEMTLTYEDPRRVAAILLETVVGSNGVIVAPAGYLEGVRTLCDRYGILFILDEVMTGYGRIGAAFGYQRLGVVPDIVTFAKGITSAYLPLGGAIVREEIAAYFDRNAWGGGHTYSGHPLACAAGLGALRAYRDGALFERGCEIEGWLRDGLTELARKHPQIGDVRGVGAFFGLELVHDRATREPLVAWQGGDAGPMPKFFAALRDRGVYAFGRYNVVIIAPPLTIERGQLDEGIAGLDGALTAIGA
ncbi:MAG: aminotransferase class III-fold pyridoxal phosphate-dependent enzyme [Vulcanimicrobiaceae bacterium]